MNRRLWIVAVLLVTVLGYGAYVWTWATPQEPTNMASSILGGCETTEWITWSDWPPSEKFVPPFVRCVVLASKKQQVISANFRQGWYTDISTVQFYVRIGGNDLIPREYLSEYRIANQGIVLRSLDWLFDNGQDPNQCSPEGLTALHLAVYFKRPDLYEKWIELGADPDNRCDDQSYVGPGGRHIRRVNGTAREWHDNLPEPISWSE